MILSIGDKGKRLSYFISKIYFSDNIQEMVIKKKAVLYKKGNNVQVLLSNLENFSGCSCNYQHSQNQLSMLLKICVPSHSTPHEKGQYSYSYNYILLYYISSLCNKRLVVSFFFSLMPVHTNRSVGAVIKLLLRFNAENCLFIWTKETKYEEN